MKAVTVTDIDGDTARVESPGTGTVHLETSYTGDSAVLLILTPEAARQLGLALIAFSLEAERG